MRSRKWKVSVGIGAAVLVAGGVAGVAGIAGAEPTVKSKTFVDGFDALTDDFNDHEREAGVLCDGCDNSQDNDLVLLWQSLLASQNYLIVGDIDGDFGPETAAATARWQEVQGLEATGEVDRATWGRMDDGLHREDGDGSGRVIYGDLSDGYVTFERAEGDGAYTLVGVADDDGGVMVNGNKAERIELFEETIELERIQ